MKKYLFVILLLVVTGAGYLLLGSFHTTPKNNEFRWQILKLIWSANAVVVNEKSSIVDLPSQILEQYRHPVKVHIRNNGVDEYPEAISYEGAPIFTYKTIQLSILQKLVLTSRLLILTAPKDADTIDLCIHQYRHEFSFELKNKQSKKLEICFGCGSLYWDGERESIPKAPEFISLFAEEVSSLGLEPQRDWKAYFEVWRSDHPESFKEYSK